MQHAYHILFYSHSVLMHKYEIITNLESGLENVEMGGRETARCIKMD